MSSALILAATALVAALLAAGGAAAADPQPTGLPAVPGSEAEPNGPGDPASPIVSGERIRASLYPNGDIDRYRFTAEAGDRVYATAMTSGSAGNSRDAQLTLLGSDGTTVVEFDDDNGSLTGLSPSIAGATIPSAGTYYLDVRDFTAGTTTIRPYDLWLEVRSGAPPAEAEPNNAASSANALGGGIVAGAHAQGGDQDFYALELDAGDTVFLSLDLDPERDGTTFNGRLGFGADGSIVVVNDSGDDDDVDSESYVATVPSAGTYYAYVDSVVAGAGGPNATYDLSATVVPADRPSCRTYTITPSPGTIPTPGVAIFPIEVADAGTLDRVAVKLDATHDRMSDLEVTLQAPGGNQTALFTDIGAAAPGTSDTRMLALFDDNAGAPPHSALLRSVALQPEFDARLGYFSGQQAAGTWNLIVRDDQATSAGTLARADLILCARPAEGPVDTVFAAGFESGDDGFVHSGIGDEWEDGVPATEPTTTGNPVAGLATCAEGQRCFKTNLDGAYGMNSSQDLVSPPISLEGRTGTIYASWAMWYQLESASFDHASVTVEEDGGGNPRPLFTWLGASMTTVLGSPNVNVPLAAGWGVHRADVSEYAGKTIRLRFHLDTDQTVALAGLAVDDVRVYQPQPDAQTVDPAAAPPATAPATAPAVVEPAISDLWLGSRCVRRSRSGRVRVPMTMRLAQPGAIVVSIDRAVGSKNRRSCPRHKRTRDYGTRFRRVLTVRPRTRAVAAAVVRRATLNLRLKPGLYRIRVQVQLEGGRLSRPVVGFVRIVG